MNVVHAGSTYQIYGESVKTYNLLPTRTYEVCFNKMTGFYLSSRNNLIVQEEKIYGEGPRKVDKVLRAFEATDRNFGVILSGRKGIGKSLFARLLATRAVDYSLPLIIVSDYFPGIASFLSSIEQEVIVLFDEFDKTFASSDDANPQEELLPLFDGLDGGKKLFIVTCNEVHKLNSYLLNRPGRFHYHFILNNPSSEDIREYMTDKLKLEYHNVIDRVITFSMTADITYDILRAIAFELNNGYSFEETIADLNISKEGAPSFMVFVTLNNGETRTAIFNNVDLSDDDNEGQWFYNKNQRSRKDGYHVCFKGCNVKINFNTSEIYVDPEDAELYFDNDYLDPENPEDAKELAFRDTAHITKITLQKIENVVSYKYTV